MDRGQERAAFIVLLIALVFASIFLYNENQRLKNSLAELNVAKDAIATEYNKRGADLNQRIADFEKTVKEVEEFKKTDQFFYRLAYKQNEESLFEVSNSSIDELVSKYPSSPLIKDATLLYQKNREGIAYNDFTKIEYAYARSDWSACISRIDSFLRDFRGTSYIPEAKKLLADSKKKQKLKPATVSASSKSSSNLSPHQTPTYDIAESLDISIAGQTRIKIIAVMKSETVPTKPEMESMAREIWRSKKSDWDDITIWLCLEDVRDMAYAVAEFNQNEMYNFSVNDFVLFDSVKFTPEEKKPGKPTLADMSATQSAIKRAFFEAIPQSKLALSTIDINTHDGHLILVVKETMRIFPERAQNDFYNSMLNFWKNSHSVKSEGYAGWIEVRYMDGSNETRTIGK